MSNTPHAKLRKEICEYLKSIGAWYVSTNSQGYGRKGIQDIISCVQGLFLAIEVKVGRDKQTPWQLREHEAVLTARGVAIVARCVDDVRRAVAYLLVDVRNMPKTSLATDWAQRARLPCDVD